MGRTEYLDREISEPAELVVHVLGLPADGKTHCRVQNEAGHIVELLREDGLHLKLTPLNPPVEAIPLVLGRRSILGSCIGGMPETQEVLDFCAEHGVS